MDFFGDIGGGIQDQFKNLYYDSGIFDVWRPFGDGITGMFEGVSSGVANVARGIGGLVGGAGDNFTLLIYIAGAAVIVYGGSLLLQNKK